MSSVFPTNSWENINHGNISVKSQTSTVGMWDKHTQLIAQTSLVGLETSLGGGSQNERVSPCIHLKLNFEPLYFEAYPFVI